MPFDIQNWGTGPVTMNRPIITLTSGMKKGAPTQWFYQSQDETIDILSADGYFNAVKSQVSIDDVIYAAASDGATFLTVSSIVNGVVSTQETISGQDLPDGSVTTAKLADGAVTTPKLADAAVTNIKLADSSVGTSNLIDLSVSTIKIIDSAVTTAKINDRAVTGTKIAFSTIQNENILDGTIGFSKLQSHTVASGQLDLTTIQYNFFSISPAQMYSMYNTPVLLIGVSSSGSALIVEKFVIQYFYNTITYSGTGGNIFLCYAGSAGTQIPATLTIPSAGFVDQTTNRVSMAMGGFTSNRSLPMSGANLYLTNDTGSFATGNGTLIVHVWYQQVGLPA